MKNKKRGKVNWCDDRSVDIRESSCIDEQRSMKDEFEAAGHGMHSFQYSEWLWHTASPSSEECSFYCISHPLCLSGSLSLSPPLPSLPLPASHSSPLVLSNIFFLSISRPLSLSHPHLPSSFLPLPLVLCSHRGMQYVAGCGSVAADTCDSAAGWVTFICAWSETALEQVCVFLHVLFTACRDLALSSVADKRARSSSLGDWERVCCCAATGKKIE